MVRADKQISAHLNNRIAAILTACAAIAVYLLFGPIIDETYFRLDAVGSVEGDLLISEMLTDLNSVDINWLLLGFLICATLAVIWLTSAGLLKSYSNSGS